MLQTTILSREQIRALNSPIRQDIMTFLRAYGEATASEISAQVRLDEHLLYYHIRCLTKVGLVFGSGSRAGATKPETIYSARAPGTTSELDLTDEATRKEVKRNVQTILKTAAKEYCQASDIYQNEDRDDWILVRVTTSVSPEVRKEMALLVEQMRTLLKQNSQPDGEPIGFTLVISPLTRSR